MNMTRMWSIVAVTGAVFSSGVITQAGESASARANLVRGQSEQKTAFFGLCRPNCGYGSRGCGYGYGGCAPYQGYGYYGGGYGAGCYPRPACPPCGPVGGCYGGIGYGGGYGYCVSGGYYGAPVAPVYQAPVYGAPAYGVPGYGVPYYQGLGYNSEDDSPSVTTPSYSNPRRNMRPALAEDDSPFFQ